MSRVARPGPTVTLIGRLYFRNHSSNYYDRSEPERVLFTNIVGDLVGDPTRPNANISGSTGAKWPKI